jgi:hypothetical protein
VKQIVLRRIVCQLGRPSVRFALTSPLSDSNEGNDLDSKRFIAQNNEKKKCSFQKIIPLALGKYSEFRLPRRLCEQMVIFASHSDDEVRGVPRPVGSRLALLRYGDSAERQNQGHCHAGARATYVSTQSRNVRFFAR